MKKKKTAELMSGSVSMSFLFFVLICVGGFFFFFLIHKNAPWAADLCRLFRDTVVVGSLPTTISLSFFLALN